MEDALKVKTDSPHDKFIWTQALVDIICIINDVPAEDQGSANCIDEIHGPAEGDKDANYACHHYIVWLVDE